MVKRFTSIYPMALNRIGFAVLLFFSGGLVLAQSRVDQVLQQAVNDISFVIHQSTIIILSLKLIQIACFKRIRTARQG